MGFIKLQFRPGVNRDTTDYSNEGGWYETDKVRFRSGYPEKIGGWAQAVTVEATGAPISFVGICRQMWNWITTYTDNLLALGTNVKVYIITGDGSIAWPTYYDITPLRENVPVLATPDTNNVVYTTAGSNRVTFTLPVPHFIEDAAYVVISGVTPNPGDIGGIPTSEINGNHLATPINATSFYIETTTWATSSTAAQGGAAITIQFELEPGFPNSSAGYGWGTGTWGRKTWGSAWDMSIPIQARDWWFDNFDNDLVMNIRNGPGYWWERGTDPVPDTALAVKAIPYPTYAFNWASDPLNGPLDYTAVQYRDAVPVKIGQLLVSQQDKHIIALGAVPFGSTNPLDFDPMLIRWADQDTPTDWIPDQFNTAGDIRLSRGSRIIRALPTKQEILVWTDSHLYSFQFLGTSDVFGSQQYAENTSIMSPRSCITAANTTYWMGKDKFYAYTGRIETLPCTLRDHVFNDVNKKQSDQVVCGTNEEWQEVWWFYPSKNSPFNDRYVIYNYSDQIWYHGELSRSAWLDTPMREYPLACWTPEGGSFGWLFEQEKGYDADGLPLPAFIQSSDFDIGEGDKFMLTRRMIPDLTFKDSTQPDPEVTMQIGVRRFPGDHRVNDPTDSKKVLETVIGEYTRQVFIRARSRQMALRISSSKLGVKWSLGSPRLDAREDAQQ